MRLKRWMLGGFLFLAVAGACNIGIGATPAATRSAAPVVTASSSPARPAALPAPAATEVATATPAGGEQVTVAHVVDGDTFTLTDGRKVRVLGIDSCEMSTYGGKEAKTTAEGRLNSSNGPFTLTAEPGVDLDRYGRLLRYVTMKDGYDFGEDMVKNDHTGVYQGKNDASPQYLQRLYAADQQYSLNPPAGRNCDDPYPTADGGGTSSDDRNRNHRDGALTRGYCGHHWYC